MMLIETVNIIRIQSDININFNTITQRKLVWKCGFLLNYSIEINIGIRLYPDDVNCFKYAAEFVTDVSNINWRISVVWHERYQLNEDVYELFTKLIVANVTPSKKIACRTYRI